MGSRELTAAVGVVAVLLAGCGGDGDDGATASPTPQPASPTDETTAPPTPTAPADATTTPDEQAAELADGKHPGYVTEVDVAGRAVTVDVVQFLTGEEAAVAAEEDGEESPPPNDYYVRNANPRLRTVPVADGARITVNVLAAAETGSSTEDVEIDLEELASYGDELQGQLFWVTADGGEVVALEQQYLP